MLGKTGRRWLRIIHITMISFLLGGLVSVFAISRMNSLIGEGLFIATYSMYHLFNWVVTLAFFGIMITGIVYSAFTHWGLTKHWWVIGKWVGMFICLIIVWFWLGPAINGMVALSDAARDTGVLSTEYGEYSQAIGPAIVLSLLIFIGLIIITIFRPWGQRERKYSLSRRTIILSVTIPLVLCLLMGLFSFYDLESYRNMNIDTPDLARIPDGDYEGQVTYAGFTYIVEIKISAHQIVNIELINNRQSHFARFAEGIIPRIIDSQSPDVDGITGATTTSKCLMKAVETALKGATK